MEDIELKKQIKITGYWEDALRAIDENMLVVATKSAEKSIPGVGTAVSVLDDLSTNALKKKVDKSRKELVACLKKASPNFTLDSVSDEDFITDFANLYEANLRLRSNEKVQFMANLFVSAHCGEVLCGLDEYDEMLERLNRLSLREIKLLYLLHKHGGTSEKFYKDAGEELGIETELINNMLSSITQSGFCKEKVGAFLSYTGNTYYTTELYSRFLSLIHIDDGVGTEEKERRKKKREEGALLEDDIITEEDIDTLSW